MLFAEVSDAVWFALIAALAVAVKQYLDVVAARGIATKVERVATTLAVTNAAHDEKLDGITQTGNATHTLVNSQRIETLRLYLASVERNARYSEDKANQTNADADMEVAKADIDAVIAARKMLREQEERQIALDAPIKKIE